MSILKILRQISKEANEKVDRINYGGCAVMASLVAEALESRGIEVEGITCQGNPYEIRSMNNNDDMPSDNWDARIWEKNGAGFNHVAVRFKYKGRNYTYDTDVLNRGADFGTGLWRRATGKFGEGFSVKELKKIAATEGFWNNDFNRKDIPKLKKIVKKHMKEKSID